MPQKSFLEAASPEEEQLERAGRSWALRQALANWANLSKGLSFHELLPLQETEMTGIHLAGSCAGSLSALTHVHQFISSSSYCQ